MLYGVSGIMGIAAVTFSRDLFVETAGLFAIALMFIYIFLTDANHIMPQIKTPKDVPTNTPEDLARINAAEKLSEEEKKKQDSDVRC